MDSSSSSTVSRNETNDTSAVEASSPSPLTPNGNDIICGQNPFTNQTHQGNRLLKSMMHAKVVDYAAEADKKGRMSITKQIVQDLKEEPFHSRFLKQAEDGTWYELSDQKARDKVGHALRFAIKQNPRLRRIQDTARRAAAAAKELAVLAANDGDVTQQDDSTLRYALEESAGREENNQDLLPRTETGSLQEGPVPEDDRKPAAVMGDGGGVTHQEEGDDASLLQVGPDLAECKPAAALGGDGGFTLDNDDDDEEPRHETAADEGLADSSYDSDSSDLWDCEQQEAV